MVLQLLKITLESFNKHILSYLFKNLTVDSYKALTLFETGRLLKNMNDNSSF